LISAPLLARNSGTPIDISVLVFPNLGGPDLAPYQVVLNAASEKFPNPIKAARTAGLSFDVRNERSETPLSLARDTCTDKTVELMKQIKSEDVTADIKSRAQARMDARREKPSRQASTEDVR
jgi:hypothetical protein